MHPVKEKEWPNYYSQISEPMDLSQIRMKINENAYATREEFLADIRLIYNNSLRFNGRYSSYTETAMKMCSHVMEEFCHKELKLMRLESLVNPLLDEDDLVGLSFLLQQAIEAMRAVEHSRPFHTPVDKRRYPDYYKQIVNPMDLSTLEKLVKENRFRSRVEFLTQVDLILSNCIQFNGPESPLSEIAKNLVEAARARLEQDAEMLDTIEANIRSNQPDSAPDAEMQQSEAGLSSHEESVTQELTGFDQTSSKNMPSTSADGTRGTGVNLSELSAAGTQKTGPVKRRASCTTAPTRPHKMAKLMESEADLAALDSNSQPATFDKAEPENASRPPPWVTDEESITESVDRFARIRHDAEPSWSSQPPTRDGTRISRDDSNHSHSALSPSSLPAGSHRTRGHVRSDGERDEEDADEEEEEDEELEDPDAHEDALIARLGSHSFSEDSMTDLPGWDSNRMQQADDSPDAYSTHRHVTYIDEETRFSMGETAGQPPAVALTDELVAQDLQLTDSDDGSSLSGQGGELCADSDMSFLTSRHRIDPHTTTRSQFAQHTDDGSSNAVWNFSSPGTAGMDEDPSALDDQVSESRRPDPVAFFISEGEDDSSDR
ncbi:unnamed protein product [Echinostoma caproni]|uniref:Bromo domain-containing protein n=1 Tax=Echinostoma caproni TaxID=27848 RepID=A0A183AJ70_9TREM|nr:unnamed protein product [Echinostoma caproni]